MGKSKSNEIISHQTSNYNDISYNPRSISTESTFRDIHGKKRDTAQFRPDAAMDVVADFVRVQRGGLHLDVVAPVLRIWSTTFCMMANIA
jgi:hypothetical protein